MERWMHWAALTAAAVLSAVSGVSLSGVRALSPQKTERKMLLLRWGIALVLWADVGLLLLLAIRLTEVWSPAGRGRLWADGAWCGVCLLAAGALRLWPVSLFPEDSGALLLSDNSQRRRLTACLWRLLAGFAFFGGWLVFLLWALTGESAAAAGMLAFTAAAMLSILWGGRQSIRTAYERIETLVDRQYQAELLNFMQVIRSQRHDFNFHMQAVAGMIENERYGDCREYVREMVKHVEQLNDVLPLKNPVIGALVNTFQEVAASRGIRLEVQALSQLEDMPCTVYEANSILGNLLQNAIDETEEKTEAERWIKLLIMKRSRRHIIKVSNPCHRAAEDYENVFRVGYSTKQSHEGIGLVSVRKLAVKYGGTVYLEHDPGVVHFIVKIPEKEAAQG